MKKFKNIFFTIGSYLPIFLYSYIAGATGFTSFAVKQALLIASVFMVIYMVLTLKFSRINYFDISFSFYFFFGLIAAYFFPKQLLWIYTVYTPANIYVALTLMAFIPLMLKIEPFTYYYAKKSQPEAIWQTKEFKEINIIITFVWGGIFLISAIFGIFANGNFIFTTLLPFVLQLGIGLPFTLKFPLIYMRIITNKTRKQKGDKKMKIIAILGSPHRTMATTYEVVKQVLIPAKKQNFSTEIIFLSDLKINYCTGCGSCLREGSCPIKDEMEELQQKILSADGIILSSPVYIFSVTAQMKTFLDRLVAWGHRPCLQRKYGLSVVTSAGYGEEKIADYLNSFLKAIGTEVVGKINGIAIGPKTFLDKEVLFSYAEKIGEELILAIKEKRKYPISGESISEQKFIRDLIYNNQTFFKADYKYWQEKGWFDNLLEKKVSSIKEGKKEEMIRKPKTFKETIEGMPLVFRSENSKGLDTIIQFKVTGNEKGNWYLKIKDQKCICYEGISEKSNMTITTPSEVWLKIACGELSGQEAYLTGKYKVEGDLNVLFQMNNLFLD